jgi:hypothetical protein
MAAVENDQRPATMEPNSVLPWHVLKKSRNRNKKPVDEPPVQQSEPAAESASPQSPAPPMYDELSELRRLDQMVERAVAEVKLSYGFEPVKATIQHALDDLIGQSILEEVASGNGVRLCRVAKQSEATQ